MNVFIKDLNKNLSIRNLNIHDIDQVIAIGKTVDEFRVSDQSIFWPKEILASWIQSETDITLGAFINDILVGFILFGVHLPTKKATWENTWIDPNFRKLKIADFLFSEALRRLTELKILFIVSYIKMDNEPILRFVEKLGFHKDSCVWWITKFL